MNADIKNADDIMTVKYGSGPYTVVSSVKKVWWYRVEVHEIKFEDTTVMSQFTGSRTDADTVCKLMNMAFCAGKNLTICELMFMDKSWDK